jgi:hypothetical protein
MLCWVDANFKFISVNVGAYGKTFDGSIFKNSNLEKKWSSKSMPPSKRLPASDETSSHTAIGHEAFPLHTYLMRPHSRDKARGNEEKGIQTSIKPRAKCCRKCVWNLVRKYRIFEHGTCMCHEHKNSVEFAPFPPSNYLRNETCQWTDSDLNIRISDRRGLEYLEWIVANAVPSAMEVRDWYRHYFNSDVGSVQWQRNKFLLGKRM